MSERTPSDIICSDECNTYVMSCHLNRDELYKAMRDDIAMMCKEYATLKAQRDELLAVLADIGSYTGEGRLNSAWQSIVKSMGEKARAAIIKYQCVLAESIEPVRANRDEFLAIAKELLPILRAEPALNNQKYDALGARFLAAIADAEKDKPEC